MRQQKSPRVETRLSGRMDSISGGAAVMIPLKLNIRNFLCYREGLPTLDLSGVHVACLCGGNGHGKSALLDAITWALWGRARGRTQDDLISYGADESRVELEFSSRESRFRVIRSHSKPRARGRQGATDLQLQLLDGAAPQPVGGNTIRETQAKIDQLIGMDYTTFINSAFLMQGRADEFTKKTPAERKTVLSSLLGLEAYDRLQARARARGEATRTAADRTAGTLEQMGREVESIGDVSTELAAVGQHLEGLEKDLAGRRLGLEGIRVRFNELARQREELDRLRDRIRSIEQEVAQLTSRISQGEERVNQYRAVAGQSEVIEQGVAQLKKARTQFETLERARERYGELDRQRQDLDRVIAGQRTRLEAQLETLRRRVETELLPKSQALPNLLEESEKAQLQEAEISRQEEDLGRGRRRLQELAAEIGEAQTLAERRREEGQEVRRKLDLLKSAGQGAVCPLCQSTLGDHGSHRLAASYQQEIQERRRQYRDNETRLKALQAQKSQLENDLTLQEQKLARDRRAAEARLGDVQRQIEESQQAQEELQRADPELKGGLASLESGEFASGEREELARVQGEIEALGYDDAQRQDWYQEMRRLQDFESRQQQLAQARELLPQEEAAAAQNRDMADRRRQDLAEGLKRIKSSEESLAQLPDLEAELKAEESAVASLEQQQADAVSRRGFLRGQLERLEGLQREITATKTRLQALEQEQSICQDLYTAFGRQGVQAMLIETVVPRLEEEANHLLGRMTDYRMHLKLETQRERRTGRGEAVETLEINVQDELGPRSYEMYSGGEAFRVNLALRIALSKVLAQRMGAPLPTLFIDEGFGTQDAAGREQVLDVISVIQDDFEQIIVITHLDDLKDMFPVRIEVQKGDHGSTFWLS